MTIFTRYLLAFCSLWLAIASFAADPYEVSGIQLDVRGDSDVQAKSKALRLAQSRAFDIVIKRLLPAGELQKAKPPLTAKQMAGNLSVLVGGLQIGDERFGSGRYLAEATVRFKPHAMRRLFAQRGVAYAENFSAPLLLLPLQRRGNDVVLWSDDNLLLNAIRKNKLPQGLLPYVVPYGDIEDITLLTANDAKAFIKSPQRGVAFADIVRRYNVGGVILMQGDIQKDKIIISARMLAHGRASNLPKQTYALSGQATSKIISTATLSALKNFQESWKRANLISDANDKTIYAILNGNSLVSLHKQLQRLRSMSIIDKAHAIRVSAQQAIIEISFRASLEQLQLALLNYGLRLDQRQSTGHWYLRVL